MDQAPNLFLLGDAPSHFAAAAPAAVGTLAVVDTIQNTQAAAERKEMVVATATLYPSPAAAAVANF